MRVAIRKFHFLKRQKRSEWKCFQKEKEKELRVSGKRTF